VYEPLFLTDMTLALLVMVSATVLGRHAGRLHTRPDDARRLRRALDWTAALVLLRLVAAGLVLTGGFALADARLVVQVPLAVLPTAWAVVAVRRRWSPTRVAMAAHVAAAGALLSGWWLFVPFGPQDAVAVVVGSLAALGAIAGTSAVLSRWRTSGARASTVPWLAVAFLLVPAVALVPAYLANTAPAGHEHHHAAEGAKSVDQLTGPRDRTPDVRVTLTAARGAVRLASGGTVDGLTFNGTAPGPQIRARQGQLVEVTLVNTDVEEGVTVHWHGVDVPNAEDGVPGVTQEAVRPGGRHVYRFVPNRAGSFWYHTHRESSTTVQRGLFGSLVIDGGEEFDGVERTLFTHAWPAADGLVTAFDTADQPAKQAVPAGRNVLVRLVNSTEEPRTVHVGGTAFTVAAIDGNAVQGATTVASGTGLPLAAGGRYDVAFTMPSGAVTLSFDTAALAFSPDGAAEPAASGSGPLFDPLAYGSGATPAPDRLDRSFDLRLDDGFGFAQGRFDYVSSSINGRLYPAVPTLVVAEGDEVRVRVANRGIVDHPLHLHGHRVRVLSRDGVPATGSPWWTDTFTVAPGQVFEVAFTADNPGIWMDHCHNFRHGSNGMIMHLAYEGVSSPFSEDHIPE
jgi:FtsP/CotA-like multicopper oxidase with cupredoxin domain